MKNDKERESHKEKKFMATVTEYISTQYNLKQAFKKFGKKAEDATEKDWMQIKHQKRKRKMLLPN